MTFMENSYVTTKAVMNSKGSDLALVTPTQVTSGTNQGTSGVNQISSRTSSNTK
jgi:hypothetical protein